MKKPLYAVYKIDWTEYERGWGCRPDGTSYYRTKQEADTHIEEFMANRNDEGRVPDEYSSPGTPTLVEIFDKNLYDKIQKGGPVWA